MDFHQVPSLFSWSQLYSHEELRLQSVLDLRGLRIAALEGRFSSSICRACSIASVCRRR